MKTNSVPLVLCCLACVFAQETPRQTVKGLKAAKGLEVTLWASEPDVVNPTNLDIDERGRVWVLEGVNYRQQLKHQKDYRAAGDRILILEDTNGDGKADKVKVFDQSPELRAPLGIAVLGDKVIISQSPNVIVYTKDAEDRVVKKEVLLTGWNGIDHDHGVHATVFGPDGRYYLNSGDPGFDITDKSGRHLTSSKSGPYFAGTSLRVNPDGTEFTVIGHNFRNPYELALDSFGNIWQTDNDDDGNAWTRVNYVMEGGNFGYWGPYGRSWREDKSSHFHNELPGVVPNIARTGAGAPCGLVVYEGKLLPEKYRGQLIHAEAGKRVINTYFLSDDGAGYGMRTEETVSAEDNWFRPSDVAVSPDGAVYIADWYDASVGGHQMKDIRRGRIYRLAPAGYQPRVPKVDLESPEGIRTAFRSPAQSVRYLAYSKLKDQGQAALPALQSMWKQGDGPLKARALWLLGSLHGEGDREIHEALHDSDPRFRILALRVLRRNGADMLAATRPLLHDPSAQVRREIAILLQDPSRVAHPYGIGAPPAQPGPRDEALADALVELARQYDGKDRWYLEALGIAARGREDLLYTRLRQAYPEKWNPLLGQLLWEFRPPAAVSYLISSLRDSGLSTGDRAQALDALANVPTTEAGLAVASLLSDGQTPPELADRAFTRLSRQLFSEWIELRKSPEVVAAVRRALETPRLQASALELTDDLGDPVYGPELLAMARSKGAPEEVRAAAIQALGRTQNPEYVPALDKFSQDGPTPLRVAAIRGIGYERQAGLEAKLGRLLLTQAPNEVRTEAVRILGRSDAGLNLLLDLQQKGELPAELKNIATLVTHASRNPAIQSRAVKLLPAMSSKNKTPLPPVRVLLSREGSAERGRRVFQANEGPKCSNCHTIGHGKKIGPDLGAVGSKLGKEAILDAILNPSAGIAPEFYVWILETKTQGQVIGIIDQDTPQRVVMKTDTGEDVRLKPSEIVSRRRSKLSMMPEDLVNSMTEQQLVDLLEYLTTLKENTRAAR